MNTKISKLFAGTLLMGLWACSSDEPAGLPTGGDHKAYLAVDIRDANSNTRSTTSEDFANGEEFENRIHTNLFVFFDADGHYMCTGEINSGEFSNPGNGETEDGSVEKIGRNIIVLSGLNGIDYPRYMLTVLNNPVSLRTDIETNKYNMADTQALIPSYVPAAGKAFMMTTSTHKGTDSMVTDLSKYTLYTKEPTAADVAESNWAKVYVERLAAGVEVSIADNEFILRDDYYIGTADREGNVSTSKTKLKVKIEGWGLNSTARESRLSKDISGIASPLDGWIWDNKDYHRSYWGKSEYYGKDLRSDYIYTGTTTPYAKEDLTLQYYNWAQMSNKFKGDTNAGVTDYRAYCLENTNIADKIKNGNKLLAKNVTCAIVKATVVAVDENEVETPVDAIRYQGILFDRSSFVPYALSLVEGAGKLPYYVVESEEKDENGKVIKTNYSQLGTENFELRLTGEGTGIVTVYQKIAEGTTVFKRDGDTYTPMTDLTEINQNLRAVIGTAMAYTGGAMFYVIPIRHLRDIPEDDTQVREGQYGIVRNHLYQIAVSNIKTLGHGVFEPGTGSSSSSTPDPGEPIIPDDPDPEFYVSARINILAWRVVNQSIEL